MITKPKERDKWDRAIASIQLDRFDDTFTKNKVNDLLKKITSDKIRIIVFRKPNLIIFEKKEGDFMQAGKHIEKWLLKNFNLKGKKKGDK